LKVIFNHLKGGFMTKEVLQGKVVSDCKVEVEATGLEFLKDNTQSKGLLRFQKQQVTNQQVKEEMARELAAMELPEDAVNQILHLEDEPPF